MEIRGLDEIFITPIFKTKLLLDNEKILSYCHSLRKKDSGRSVSNMGGWQSSDVLGSPSELKNLYNSIAKFAGEIADVLEIDSVKVHNLWININGYKDFNWPHTHDDAILSGVYYVKTPENCGNIQFDNPSSRVTLGHMRIKNFNKFNSPSWWMPSSEGLLYIFPAWLPHGVKPNFNENEERVSISFNLIH
jgi:uncharacterized protein (TIGR02466 family)